MTNEAVVHLVEYKEDGTRVTKCGAEIVAGYGDGTRLTDIERDVTCSSCK